MSKALFSVALVMLMVSFGSSAPTQENQVGEVDGLNLLTSSFMTALEYRLHARLPLSGLRGFKEEDIREKCEEGVKKGKIGNSDVDCIKYSKELKRKLDEFVIRYQLKEHIREMCEEGVLKEIAIPDGDCATWANEMMKKEYDELLASYQGQKNMH